MLKSLARFTGVVIVGQMITYFIAGILALYVLAISGVARGEAKSPKRIKLVVAMVCAISLLDAAFLVTLHRGTQAVLAVGCFILAALGQRRILGS